MDNQIIVVEQLPIITEKLQLIKSEVAEKVKIATSLVCTEETVKEVKKARAELSKDFRAWEDRRKEVKAAVMSPYEQFEAVYKDCITNTYQSADSDLKRKIDSVESELKAKKEKEVREYFTEYLASRGIDFVTYEQAGINVTLSASIKNLKELSKAFIDRICDDLALIDLQDHKTEILVEYKQTLNVSTAIASVVTRLQAVEAEKAKQETTVAVAEEQPVILAPPTVEEPEEEFVVRFVVTATMPKLKELKQFLTNGGYKYE